MRTNRKDGGAMDTKKSYAASLEKLLSHKTLDDIHVREIVAGSEFSRKTFYRHFKDKYDLTHWYFACIFEESFGLINHHLSWDEALLTYLEKYQEKHLILKNAYASRDINSLRNADIALTRKTYELFLKAKGVEVDSESMKFAIEIASRGGTDMVIEWLYSGMKMEKRKLVHLIKSTLPKEILQFLDEA